MTKPTITHLDIVFCASQTKRSAAKHCDCLADR